MRCSRIDHSPVRWSEGASLSVLIALVLIWTAPEAALASACAGCGGGPHHLPAVPTDGPEILFERGALSAGGGCRTGEEPERPDDSSARGRTETAVRTEPPVCACGCSGPGVECPAMTVDPSDDLILCVNPCPCSGAHVHSMVSVPRLPTGLTPSPLPLPDASRRESIPTLYALRASQYTPAASHGPPR
jgi:hypothetical protein